MIIFTQRVAMYDHLHSASCNVSSSSPSEVQCMIIFTQRGAMYDHLHPASCNVSKFIDRRNKGIGVKPLMHRKYMDGSDNSNLKRTGIINGDRTPISRFEGQSSILSSNYAPPSFSTFNDSFPAFGRTTYREREAIDIVRENSIERRSNSFSFKNENVGDAKKMVKNGCWYFFGCCIILGTWWRRSVLRNFILNIRILLHPNHFIVRKILMERTIWVRRWYHTYRNVFQREIIIAAI